MNIESMLTPLARGHMFGGDGTEWSHMMFGQSGGWMHPFGGIFLILLAVAVGVFLFRVSGGTSSSSACIGQTPEEILKSRFARGEIDRDEYEERLAAIR